jgi:thiol-disulfide isomerase/thioredoxin
MKRIQIFIVFLLFCVLAVSAAAEAAEEVSAAPLFGEFKTYDIYGEPFTYEIFADSDLTLVNIWGTYCPPCINEMPYLGELSREYAEKNVAIVGIALDVYDAGSLELAREIVSGAGADFIHLLTAEAMTDALADVLYIPTTFFVDSQGRQVGEMIIGSREKEVWAELIEQYLAMLTSE